MSVLLVCRHVVGWMLFGIALIVCVAVYETRYHGLGRSLDDVGRAMVRDDDPAAPPGRITGYFWPSPAEVMAADQALPFYLREDRLNYQQIRIGGLQLSSTGTDGSEYIGFNQGSRRYIYGHRFSSDGGYLPEPNAGWPDDRKPSFLSYSYSIDDHRIARMAFK